MSFVTTSPPDPADEPEIDAGAFWPTTDPSAVRDAMRIDGGITPARLRGALVEALAAVGDELRDWRLMQQTRGYSALADVPADEIDGASILVQRWRRAVACIAKANILERYRDYDSTAHGEKKADRLDSPIEDLRRDARWALSDILGTGRTLVELI